MGDGAAAGTVSLFSGLPADPPAGDFISRNAMDAQEVAVGWWPGDARYGKAAFYAYAHPAPPGFETATLSPAAARWEPALGEDVPGFAALVQEEREAGACEDATDVLYDLLSDPDSRVRLAAARELRRTAPAPEPEDADAELLAGWK